MRLSVSRHEVVWDVFCIAWVASAGPSMLLLSGLHCSMWCWDHMDVLELAVWGMKGAFTVVRSKACHTTWGWRVGQVGEGSDGGWISAAHVLLQLARVAAPPMCSAISEIAIANSTYSPQSQWPE